MKKINVQDILQKYNAQRAAETALTRCSSSGTREYYEARRDEAMLAIRTDETRPIINAAFDDAQKRSRVREVNFTRDVLPILSRADDVLSAACKKDRVGTRILIDPNEIGRFPGKYRGNPESTMAEFEYKKNGWFLVDVYRKEMRQDHRNCLWLSISDAARNAILERAMLVR